MTNPKRIAIVAGQLTRYLEIDEYARRRHVTLDAALIELANAALSDGALIRLRRGECGLGGPSYDDDVVDSEIVEDDDVPEYTFTTGGEATAMRLGRILDALPYAGNVLGTPRPLIENTPEQFMRDTATWLIAYGNIVFGRATR